MSSPFQQEPQKCLIRGYRERFCGLLRTDMLKEGISNILTQSQKHLIKHQPAL